MMRLYSYVETRFLPFFGILGCFSAESINFTNFRFLFGGFDEK